MAVYTIYAPPGQALDAWADAERLRFVRDGFYWWAFLLAPLWMVRHRLWLALGGYILGFGMLEAATVAVGASSTAVAMVGLLISLLVGLEAGTLRRFGLRRERWKNIGIVSGRDVEEAERRFFDAWLQKAPDERAIRSPAAPGPVGGAGWPRAASGPHVIGLFPEPGDRR